MPWVGLGLSRSQAGLYMLPASSSFPERLAVLLRAQSWMRPPSSPGSWACWPPVVSGMGSVVVLTRHLGRLSGNWEFPREKRTGQSGGSEDRRVLGEPSPPGRPLRRPHGQPQSSRSCCACSQPRVAPAHTAPWPERQGWGWVSRGMCAVQASSPGGGGLPSVLGAQGLGQRRAVRNGLPHPMPRWRPHGGLEQRQQGTRSRDKSGAVPHGRGLSGRPWPQT